MNKLVEYLDKKSAASDYFRQNMGNLVAYFTPHLEFILEEMCKILKLTVTHEQVSSLFMEQKEPSRMWF